MLLLALVIALVPGAASPAPEPCLVVGAYVTPADATRVLAACAASRARFEELLGGVAPAVRVLLHDQPGYRVRTERATGVVLWPSSAALAASGRDAGEVHSYWSEVLPHEIAHALLSARFFPAGVPPHAGYGTPLPDWFEEGVAIWSEPPANRSGRLAQARQLPVEWTDLERIVGMTHPAAGNGEAFASRDGSPLPADAALWAFYPQSIAVVGFVHALGGSAAMAELAARFLAEVPPAAALVGLPGLPATRAALLDAWREWIRGAAGRASARRDGSGGAASIPA